MIHEVVSRNIINHVLQSVVSIGDRSECFVEQRILTSVGPGPFDGKGNTFVQGHGRGPADAHVAHVANFMGPAIVFEVRCTGSIAPA